MKVFRKSKMLKRLKEQNLDKFVGPAELAMINSLDGLEAKPNRWRQTVHGESESYYCELDGKQIPVNVNDCEDA